MKNQKQRIKPRSQGYLDKWKLDFQYVTYDLLLTHIDDDDDKNMRNHEYECKKYVWCI